MNENNRRMINNRKSYLITSSISKIEALINSNKIIKQIGNDLHNPYHNDVSNIFLQEKTTWKKRQYNISQYLENNDTDKVYGELDIKQIADVIIDKFYYNGKVGKIETVLYFKDNKYISNRYGGSSSKSYVSYRIETVPDDIDALIKQIKKSLINKVKVLSNDQVTETTNNIELVNEVTTLLDSNLFKDMITKSRYSVDYDLINDITKNVGEVVVGGVYEINDNSLVDTNKTTKEFYEKNKDIIKGTQTKIKITNILETVYNYEILFFKGEEIVATFNWGSTKILDFYNMMERNTDVPSLYNRALLRKKMGL